MADDRHLEDLEAAQTGRGSRRLSPSEAIDLLNFAEENGFEFHSIETSEVDGDAEIPDISLSLLGLSAEEKSTSSVVRSAFVRRLLARLRDDDRTFLLQVWAVRR